MLYKNVLSEYLQALQRRNCSPCTIENYRGCLFALGEFLGKPELEHIQLSGLRKWIDHVIEGKPSPYTTWTKVVIARAFFNWCVDEGFLKTSPARKLDKPRLPKRIPKASTDEEIQVLLHAAGKSNDPERNVALVYFFLETGARRGAVASLKLCDISLQKRTATVVTKGDKEVNLFFGEVTKDALQNWLDVRDPKQFHPAINPECVFGLTADGIYQAIIRMKERSGISRPLSPHVLRHTSATLRAEQGIDSSTLQQIMGWNDIRMAEVYTCMAYERLKRRALDTSPVDNIINISTS